MELAFCGQLAKRYTMSAMMTLELPADVMESARISAGELRMEIAVALFRAERLSLGRAAELAELSVQSFMGVLCSRHISLHYGIDEAVEDARTLASHTAA
jgi:predicted HTH domain antitoxin